MTGHSAASPASSCSRAARRFSGLTSEEIASRSREAPPAFLESDPIFSGIDRHSEGRLRSQRSAEIAKLRPRTRDWTSRNFFAENCRQTHQCRILPDTLDSVKPAAKKDQKKSRI